jgi:hypothetical protein
MDQVVAGEMQLLTVKPASLRELNAAEKRLVVDLRRKAEKESGCPSNPPGGEANMLYGILDKSLHRAPRK